MKPTIELHIEELVLHGFDPRDREAIGEAVRLELTQLLTRHGLPAMETSHRAGLDGGTVRLQSARAEGVGSQVARSVYQSLGGIAEGNRGER